MRALAARRQASGGRRHPVPASAARSVATGQPAAAWQDAPDPPGRWLAVLGIAMLLAITTWFSASAVLPQLRVQWDLSSNAASLLTIAVQLGFVAGATASAALNLADVVPPRRLMLLGAVGAAAANALLAVAPGPVHAVLLRFATGVFLAAVYPPGLKAMATWFRRGRGTALGVMVGALTLGSAIPHLVNGLGGVQWETVVLAYVGTAVTLQLAVGFTLTVLTIWLVPVLRDHLTWQWAFAFLAPGPALGAAAMIRLMRSPEAARIAGGLG